MKKIIHFIGSLSMGGAETLVKDYAINFGENIDCTVVTLDKPETQSANEMQLSKHHVKYVTLADQVPFRDGKLQKVIDALRRARILRQYVIAEKIEVIHIHLPISRYVYFATLGLKNIKLFYTVHNEPQKIFGKQHRNDTFFVKKLMHTKNMRLVALHQDMALELNEMFHVDNTVVVNNGISLHRFQKSLYKSARSQILQQLGFQEEDFIVGHVGRYSLQKNHDYLIDVFAKLVEGKPNAKLLLIGSGELKSKIVAKINSLQLSDRVVMLENRMDIPELLSVMDVFLFPSLWEGLSVTLVEAQSMGLKCVVSDTVNMATHLTDTFLTVSLQEPPAVWVDAILDNTMRSTPHASLLDFDMRQIVKQLEGIYDQ